MGQVMYLKMFVAVGVSFAMTSAPSFAADLAGDSYTQCNCTVPGNVPPANFGRIVLSNGEVLASDMSGYKRAVVNQPVTPMTQMLAGPSGSAEIVYANNCSVTLNGGQTLSVSEPYGQGAGYCVRIAQTGPAAGALGAGAAASIGGANLTGIAAVIAGAGVLGIGVYALTASK